MKPGDKIDAVFVTGKKSREILNANEQIFLGLAKLSSMTFSKDVRNTNEYSYSVVRDVEIYLDTSALIDTEAEKERLKSEIKNKKEYIRIVDLKLTNTDFIKNAPEKIIRIEQDKKRLAEEQVEKLTEKLNMLA